MKISELIQALEGLKEKEGDVEFWFDWATDCDVILEENVSLWFSEYDKIHILAFHSALDHL